MGGGGREISLLKYEIPFTPSNPPPLWNFLKIRLSRKKTTTRFLRGVTLFFYVDTRP